MSERDGVADANYDRLRATGLSREQCWAVLECGEDVAGVVPDPDVRERNKRASGVRRPPPEPPVDPGV